MKNAENGPKNCQKPLKYRRKELFCLNCILEAKNLDIGAAVSTTSPQRIFSMIPFQSLSDCLYIMDTTLRLHVMYFTLEGHENES